MSETTSPDAAPETEAPDPADAGEAEPTGPADELREGLLATFTEALGDKVQGSHIQPGRELWVRVDRSAWVEAAEVAKNRLGCTFFDFLSAIDWMVAPWGRYEVAEIDELAGSEANAEAEAGTEADAGTGTGATPTNGHTGIPSFDPTTLATGVVGGETRFQVFCRLADVRRHHSVILTTDVGNGTGGASSSDDGPDDLRVPSLVPVFAGANWHERECWEMFGIVFEGHPSLRHLYLPGAFEGHPLRKDFPLLARLVKPWPGIVDVEPMPEPAEPPEGTTTDAGTAEGDAIADSSAHGESAADEGGAVPTDEGNQEGEST